MMQAKSKLKLRMAKPGVIWFTGLSGSGKSTIADLIAHRLKNLGVPTERLDGDSVRTIFPDTGFSEAERNAHIKRVGYLASKLESHGVFVIASLVSPYLESRQFVRNICQNFTEVYLSTSLVECEKRDVKGLYVRARQGEIKDFTGIDAPYQVPLGSELTIDTARYSIDQTVEIVMNQIESTYFYSYSKPFTIFKKYFASEL